MRVLAAASSVRGHPRAVLNSLSRTEPRSINERAVRVNRLHQRRRRPNEPEMMSRHIGVVSVLALASFASLHADPHMLLRVPWIADPNGISATTERGKAVEAARAVFIGEVISKTPTGVTFRVERVYKGEMGAELVMKGGNSFLTGERYLVFAHGEFLAELRSSSCSGRGGSPMPDQRALGSMVLQVLRAEMPDSPSVLEPLRAAALHFFDAAKRCDHAALLNRTNVEGRYRLQRDLRIERLMFSQTLLTGRGFMRTRFSRIDRLRLLYVYASLFHYVGYRVLRRLRAHASTLADRRGHPGNGRQSRSVRAFLPIGEWLEHRLRLRLSELGSACWSRESPNIRSYR